jgi:hypothetical protein
MDILFNIKKKGHKLLKVHTLSLTVIIKLLDIDYSTCTLKAVV